MVVMLVALLLLLLVVVVVVVTVVSEEVAGAVMVAIVVVTSTRINVTRKSKLHMIVIFSSTLIRLDIIIALQDVRHLTLTMKHRKMQLILHMTVILTETLNALVWFVDTTPTRTLAVPILNGYLAAKLKARVGPPRPSSASTAAFKYLNRFSHVSSFRLNVSTWSVNLIFFVLPVTYIETF